MVRRELVAVSNQFSLPSTKNNKPIRIRVFAKNVNEMLTDESKVVDLNWDSFTYLLRKLYSKDLERHEE